MMATWFPSSMMIGPQVEDDFASLGADERALVLEQSTSCRWVVVTTSTQAAWARGRSKSLSAP